MATAAREKTKYPGVTFHTTTEGERIFYIRYRRPGSATQTEEKAGKASQGMTAAKASVLRSERMEGKAPTNAQKRKLEDQKKHTWTMQTLFEKYMDSLPQNRGRKTDRSNFKHIEKIWNLAPDELNTDLVNSIKKVLSKTKSPQTIKHVVVLIGRIIKHGTNHGLIEPPSAKQLRLEKPRVDNKKTEVLTNEEQERLIKVLEEETEYIDAAVFMNLILLTGIRKSAALALKWEDVDMELKRIRLQGKEAKKGTTDYIPLTVDVEKLLLKLNKTENPYIFPSPTLQGRHRENFVKAINIFRERAKLSKDFRPIHGLRHNFASKIASSGEVNMYVLQKLLTHEDPESTQRYAHLADEALYKAANIGIAEILKKKDNVGN